MKNDKTISGLAYMFLGAALLISGSSMQEQIERLASDPNLQMVKAMYVSAMREHVIPAVTAAKTEVLAENIPAAPMQFDYAVGRSKTARLTHDPAATSVSKIEVAVQSLPQIDMASLPALPKVKMAMLTAHLEKTNFTALSALNTASEMRRVVIVRTDGPKAAKCSKPRLRPTCKNPGLWQ